MRKFRHLYQFTYIYYVAKDFRPQGLSGTFGVVTSVDQVKRWLGRRGRSFSSTSFILQDTWAYEV